MYRPLKDIINEHTIKKNVRKQEVNYMVQNSAEEILQENQYKMISAKIYMSDYHEHYNI